MAIACPALLGSVPDPIGQIALTADQTRLVSGSEANTLSYNFPGLDGRTEAAGLTTLNNRWTLDADDDLWYHTGSQICRRDAPAHSVDTVVWSQPNVDGVSTGLARGIAFNRVDGHLYMLADGLGVGSGGPRIIRWYRDGVTPPVTVYQFDGDYDGQTTSSISAVGISPAGILYGLVVNLTTSVKTPFAYDIGAGTVVLVPATVVEQFRGMTHLGTAVFDRPGVFDYEEMDATGTFTPVDCPALLNNDGALFATPGLGSTVWMKRDDSASGSGTYTYEIWVVDDCRAWTLVGGFSENDVGTGIVLDDTVYFVEKAGGGGVIYGRQYPDLTSLDRGGDDLGVHHFVGDTVWGLATDGATRMWAMVEGTLGAEVWEFVVGDHSAPGQDASAKGIMLGAWADTSPARGDLVYNTTDGYLYFLSAGVGDIFRIDPATGARNLTYSAPAGTNPASLTVGADGTLWITYYSTTSPNPQTLVAIDPVTLAQGTASAFVYNEFRNVLALDDGTVIMPEPGTTLIWRYQFDGAAVTRARYARADLSDAVSRAWDGSHNNHVFTNTSLWSFACPVIETPCRRYPYVGGLVVWPC